MDEERLKHILTAKAEREIPASLDMRQSIHGRIQLKSTLHYRLRLPRAAIIMLAILVCATGAFAYYQTFIRPDQGISAVSAENLVVQIGKTQPIDNPPDDLKNLEVTLDYAYADSNRIVVGYHLSSDAKAGDQIEFFMNPTLADAGHLAFPWIPASGQQASAPPAEQSDTSAVFRTDGIMSFDSAALQNAPSSLNLNLHIAIAYTTSESRSDNPYQMSMAGETSFQFSVPFNPGRTAVLNQSATASGITLEMKKIVIAPSLTRLEFCTNGTPFVSTSEHWLDWAASVTVDVGGQRAADTREASFSGLPGQPLSPDAACRALVIPNSLVQYTGNWVLTIHAFDNAGSQEQLTGPWTFNFSIGG